MRLLPVIFSATLGAEPSPALRQAEAFTGSHNVCGVYRSNHNGTLAETITLEPEETCIYRIKGNKKDIMEIINLNLELECGDGEMYLFTDETQYGPFCHDKRRKRAAGGYNSYNNIDPTNMHGQNFKSKEVDMVFRNGQRARFSFGFNFEFELLPGLPMGGNNGLCAWKNIKASNGAFYAHKDKTSNPEAAMNLWAQLTESMYNFQCYFDKFRDQCGGPCPVKVKCDLLEWNSSCKDMVSRIETIIKAQCAKCSGNGICAEWYGMLGQLQGLVGYGTTYGGGYNPKPYCDEDQCEEGTHECDAYATCTNECKDYTCKCNDGYEGTGKECSKICDEDQCNNAYGVNPCGANAICTNQCEGFTCECEEGYHKEGDKCVVTCDDDPCAYNTCGDFSTCTPGCKDYTCGCIEGYSMIDDVCVKDCDEDQCLDANACPAFSTCTNDCYGHTCTCIDGYRQVGDICEEICDVDPCADNTCGEFSTCTEKCKGYDCGCIEGYSMIDEVCVKDCDENQCLNENNCPDNSACSDDCDGFTCACIPGFYKEWEIAEGAHLGRKKRASPVQPDLPIIGPNGDLGTHLFKGGDKYITDPGRWVCLPICEEDPCAGDPCGDNSTCDPGCDEYPCNQTPCEYTCGCIEGYSMIDEVCVKDCDEDQCLDENACPAFSTCSNDCEGHTCTCIDGYRKVGDICEEICDEDPCADNTCGDHSTCTPGCKDYTCGCIEGYSMIGGKCIKDCDANVCDNNNCGPNTNCVKGCYDYTCECKKDYIPIPDSDPFTCKHKDPCHNVKCTQYAHCVEGKCKCDNGYVWKGDKCVEKVNECLTGAHDCGDYSTCTDTLYGYTCACNPKYKDQSPDPKKPGRKCIHPYYTEDGECYLTEYSSFTDKKFEKISYSTSYDHMSAVHYWKLLTAQLSELGEAAERTVQCAKEAGVLGCKLIDYTKDATACDWAHTLETVVAKVQEKCNEDWSIMYTPYLDKLRKATCEEPNDCEDGTHKCSADAVCKPKKAKYGNKHSGFTCTCKEGFYGNGRQCYEEVDECALGAHKCALNANCHDISAGYKCQCHPGYVGNGYVCSLAVDECELGTHDCHEYADCTDLPNGYTCKCRAKEGYVGNGKQCTGPADECAEGTHTCHATTDCVNTYAGFTCKCKEGYLGDPKKACWPPLTCPWTEEAAVNNYAGYGGDFDNGLCSLKYIKVCTKTLYEEIYAAGVKVCKRNEAFTQFNLFINELFAMGKTYEKKYGVATSHFQNYDRYGAECSVEAGAVPCSLINFHNIDSAQELFDRVKALFDHVFKVCDPVYRAKWEGWLARYHNTLICPVNECLTGNYECHPNAACVDRAIGYDCVCKKHYFGDGFDKCDEIDYCQDAALCGLYSTCTNLHPGYECNCFDGYYMKAGKCLPKDPCKTNNGGCDQYATCTSQIIGYEVNHQCKCYKGYYGDGFTCKPVDPCAQHNCDENAACVPYATVLTEADYNCKCKDGYEGNGFICNKYVDPCANVNCAAGETTQITKNSYGLKVCNCICAPGYIRVNDVCTIKDKCQITECEVGYQCEGDGNCVSIPADPCKKCHHWASCQVTGYPPAKQCVCNKPYVGDGFVCRTAKPCPHKCWDPTICNDGRCTCKSSGFWYNWGTKKCINKNECLKPEMNNCNANATCKDTHGGFTCTCNQGYTGDGVTCVKKTNNQEYSQGGNPYAGSKIPQKASFMNIDTDNQSSLALFTELTPGQCSLMGFEWAHLEIMLGKMKWSQAKTTSENYTKAILKEFQYLGHQAIARAGPQCNLQKAGVVDCKKLWFPKSEHRCQQVKRLKRIFDDVASECNAPWNSKFGNMMNFLLQNNDSGKNGADCPHVEWL